MVDEQPKQKFWQTRYFWPAVIAASLVALVFVWWAVYYFMTFKYTDDAMLDGYRSTVSTQVMGEMVDLRVNEGDPVKVGEVLAVLDGSVQRAQVEVAEAQVAESRANVNLARVAMEKARIDFERIKAAYADDIVPEQQFDDQQKIYEESVVSYHASILELAAQEAALRLAKVELNQTVIVAAMGGEVAKRWAWEGDIIQPGQPIVAVYDMADIWVTANLEETKVAKVRLGDPVTITIDAYPGRKFSGEVFEVGAATGQLFSLIPPNNASGNFTKVTQRLPIKISVEQELSEGEEPVVLRPGMSAEVRIRVR